ncbi:hypothetical protein Tco_0596371 [Tanacetum coccineum]
MVEYMIKTREDYGSGVARPKFDKDTKFELKGQFLKELRENTFIGSESEDANEHIERVLEILDLFTTPDVTQDQLMLCAFPITLTGAASRWEIKKVNERVYAAQVGCKLCNGPHYTKDCQLKGEGNILEEAYYTQFGVPFPQARRYREAALGFYQRDNENTSYQERRQTMEESLNKFMAESAKRHDEHSSLIKEIRASTDVAIRNQGASIKLLEIQIGKMSKVLQERGYASLPSSTEINPRDHVKSIITTEEAKTLKEDDELSRVVIPFPGQSATRLRRLLKEKSRIKEDIKATMNMHCSEIPKDALPPKEKDPGSFTLPCRIHNMCFDKALADLGASVSIMPYSTFTNLGLDFIVLDILEDIKIPLILGRPFLSTAHAKTDVFKRKIALRMGNDKIVFKSDNPTNSIIKKVYVLGLRERMELDIQARLIGEALILNRSQDPEFEDFLKLNDLNEPLELRNHEMEDLGPTIKEGEVIDEPMIDVVKIRSFYNSIMKEKIEYKGRYVVGAFINVPIFVGNFSIVIDFAVVENMDAYRDKDMGDVIFGKPFCRVVCVHARRPLLQVSARDRLEGNSHSYQKLKGFYKGVLNLGPEYIKDEKMFEWLTRGHVSIHEMDLVEGNLT